jgi:hypothetical protein
MGRVRCHGRIRDELPQEVREKVDRLLVEGGSTYDDIRDFLAAEGYDISRSAIGRYGKDWLNTYQRLRIAEDKARTLVSEVGDGLALDEAASRLLMQKVLELLISTELTPKERASLMKSVAILQSSSVQREKLKKELRSKVEEVAEEVTQTARRGGMSDELIREMEERVLGIIR